LNIAQEKPKKFRVLSSVASWESFSELVFPKVARIKDRRKSALSFQVGRKSTSFLDTNCAFRLALSKDNEGVLKIKVVRKPTAQRQRISVLTLAVKLKVAGRRTAS